jgi:DNA-binding protein Fis
MNKTLNDNLSLGESVGHLIKQHLESSGKKVIDLHQMVLEQIEPPLLKAVMEQCKFNQSRAAKLLGISRGTCRSMLIKYFDEQYCGRRE